MALPPLATPDDVEVRYGQAIDAAQVWSLVAQASAIVRAYARRNWVDEDGELDGVPDGVPGVVVEMVVRVLSNPTGVEDQRSGPFAVGYGSRAPDRLYLTAADRSVLNATRARVGSVDMTPLGSLLRSDSDASA